MSASLSVLLNLVVGADWQAGSLMQQALQVWAKEGQNHAALLCLLKYCFSVLEMARPKCENGSMHCTYIGARTTLNILNQDIPMVYMHIMCVKHNGR